MIITNQFTDPRLTGTVQCVNLTATRLPGGGVHLDAPSTIGPWAGAIVFDQPVPSEGDIVFVHTSREVDKVERLTLIWQSADRTLAAYRVNTPEGNRCLDVAKGSSLDLYRIALYTPDDWTRIHAMYEEGKLNIPWFCGDTIPLNSSISGPREGEDD